MMIIDVFATMRIKQASGNRRHRSTLREMRRALANYCKELIINNVNDEWPRIGIERRKL